MGQVLPAAPSALLASANLQRAEFTRVFRHASNVPANPTTVRHQRLTGGCLRYRIVTCK